MFKKSLLLFSTTLILLFNGCSKSDDANDMVSTHEYVLNGIDSKQYIAKKYGHGFGLEDAEDKVVIFDIFATWCPPCQATAPMLGSLQKKYKDQLVVVGITIEEDIENKKLQEFSEKHNAGYVFVNSDQNRVLSDEIVKELKLGERYPIPLIVMYKGGKLINHYVGATQEEFIESDLKRALGK